MSLSIFSQQSTIAAGKTDVGDEVHRDVVRHKVGISLVLGVVPVEPLKGFPEGKRRIRMRAGKFVLVYVRPPSGGIREFAISDVGGYWTPAIELGANHKEATDG